MNNQNNQQNLSVGSAYSHPMADVRTADDLLNFIVNYKRGKPSVKELRTPKNPFWGIITNLGALPRDFKPSQRTVPIWQPSQSQEGTLLGHSLNELLNPIIDNTPRLCGNEVEVYIPIGFSKVKEAVYTTHTFERKVVAATRIIHPALETMPDGYYVNGVANSNPDTIQTIKNKLESMGFEDLLKIPHTNILPTHDLFPRGMTLRAGTFKSSALLGFFDNVNKSAEMFGEKWPDAVKVGHSFFKGKILQEVLKVLAQLDTEIQFFVSADRSMNESDLRLFITTRQSVTTIMPMRHNDTNTHFVLVSDVPDEVMTADQAMLSELVENVQRYVGSLTETTTKFDQTVSSLCFYQSGLESVIAKLEELYKKLSLDSRDPAMPPDEVALQSHFVRMLVGTKNRTEERAANALYESTKLSTELLEKIREWSENGKELMGEVHEFLDDFRPRHD